MDQRVFAPGVGAPGVEGSACPFAGRRRGEAPPLPASPSAPPDAGDDATSVIEHLVDAVVTMDEHGRILRFNAAAARMFGHDPQAVRGRDVTLLMPSPWREEHAAHVRRHEHTGQRRVIGVGREVLALRADGSEFPIHLSVSSYPHEGRRRYTALIRDVTQQRRVEAEIEHLAFFDPLTELPNRRLLLDRVRQRVLAQDRARHLGALLLLDLDDFKTLNDSRGHEAGDRLLQEVAGRLRGCVRQDDTVARLGGDEFVILLDHLGEDREEAARHAERVVHKLFMQFNAPFTPGGQAHHCHASIGITLFDAGSLADGREDPDGRQRADTLLGQADLAMYEVKKTGRNGWRFFDTHLQEHLDRRVTLLEDLTQGLVRGEFELHCQPQVNLDGRVLGAEALLRWRHPRRGLVPPAEFVPEAEESGLIVDLGREVLRQACAMLARWQRQPALADLTLAVNVSVRQFHHPGFVEDVRAALAEAGAPARRLELEVTESVFADDQALVRGKMETLGAEGLRFSLDDFGIGYSSLAYLKRLPLHRLKIDQSFVHDLLANPGDLSIVRAIVTMGHSLGLEVIAEGVESLAQRVRLAEAGCTAFQGWLFGRPVPAAELERWLIDAPAASDGPVHGD